MAESIVQVTEGTGKKLHTFNRTIGANSVEDEVVLSGLPYLATYAVAFAGIAVGTANDHILQIMAGATLNVYVHLIRFYQRASATTAVYAEFQLIRLTTAGTGGTVRSFLAHDSTDAAVGATAMSLPTAKGTEGSVLAVQDAYFTQTPGAAGLNFGPVFDWQPNNPLLKPIRIPAGTANGLCVKNTVAATAATVGGYAIITEANF